MDSVEVGAGQKDGLNEYERYSVFTLWAVCCSPIVIGPDLTTLDDGDLKILTNPEVIAVQQQGIPATPIVSDGNGRVWEVRNPDGSCYVALFNLGESPEHVGASWDQLHLNGPVIAHDLWQRRDLGPANNGITIQLQPHACMLVKLTPTNHL